MPGRQGIDFRLRPRRHRQAFAAVGDSLVGGLAVVAYEGSELYADGAEAELFAFAAVGADSVGWEAGELLHGELEGGRGWESFNEG